MHYEIENQPLEWIQAPMGSYIYARNHWWSYKKIPPESGFMRHSSIVPLQLHEVPKDIQALALLLV